MLFKKCTAVFDQIKIIIFLIIKFAPFVLERAFLVGKYRDVARTKKSTAVTLGSLHGSKANGTTQIIVGDVVPGVVVYLHHLHHHSSWVGRVQWAHKWTDSGCHRRP